MALHHHAILLPDRGMKILRFPLTRFVIALIFFFTFIGLGIMLSSLFRSALADDGQGLLGDAVQMILACTLSITGYWLYCGLIEGRPVSELDPSKMFAQTGLGLLLGLGFISLIILLISIDGSYRITGWNGPVIILPALIISIQAGIIEEILTRGIVFRIPEEGLGTWWSVLISALIFGFMHIWNPNATLFSSLSIALTAGVVLALLYVITRQLWIPIGLHIGWNLTLGGIYGAPVSGTTVDGILISEISGQEMITGGAFGPEASLITLGVFLIFGIFLVRKILRDKSWIKPMWRKET